MGGEHLIGIDEGTTGVRAVVARPDGEALSHAYREIGQRFPQPSWHEQDPVEIWDATRTVIAEALVAARIRPADVGGIGVTNQRGTALAFRSDRPACDAAIGPAITWQDHRTLARCRALNAGGLRLNPLTGATKWQWLVENDAAAIPRHALRLATIDTWLAHCLSGGGVYATDHGNACVGGLYDYVGASFDETLTTALGLDDLLLPQLVDSSGIIGETTLAAFGARVPIASLTGDQHAATYAQACLRPGTLKLTLGTSGMVDLNLGETLMMPPPGAYPLVLWSLNGRRTFCLEGTVVTAGAAFQWLRDALGIVQSAAELEPLARSVPDSAGAWVVPAFQGLGTPYLEPDVRAAIAGLTRNTTRAHIARATIEGVAWRAAEVVLALTRNGTPPDAIRVDGGAAASDLLLEILASAAGLPVARTARLESAAMGAAWLAGRASGLLTDADVESWYRPERVFHPAWSEDERSARWVTWLRRVEATRAAEAGR